MPPDLATLLAGCIPFGLKGCAYDHTFRTVSRASPNCRAASRSLIFSTMTARRTRAYSSTGYTTPVFHKTQLNGNVRLNQSPAAWFYSAQIVAPARITGLFSVRRLYGISGEYGVALHLVACV